MCRFEAVEVDAAGLEIIPLPGPHTIPMPTDDDGWMECDDDQSPSAAGKIAYL